MNDKTLALKKSNGRGRQTENYDTIFYQPVCPGVQNFHISMRYLAFDDILYMVRMVSAFLENKSRVLWGGRE